MVVIYLGLGGWNLLMKYGQYVEVEGPVVVGQPIKIHGRFYHFGREANGVRYELEAKWKTPAGENVWTTKGYWSPTGWFRYDVKLKVVPHEVPTELTMKLTPAGGRPIHGKSFIRPAQ
jgi:hypothetical protein